MENSVAAIYARLSIEDRRNEISQSIENQISICKDFAVKNKIKISKIYIDDGYSGTTFNRPQFNKMIDDIKKQRISLIIFKDLSRFGRDFIQASYYLEEFLPKYGIRYISVNDNFDSSKNVDDISLPIKNYLNSLYAKEVSKKIRQYFEKNVNKKPFTKIGRYGYIVQKGKWVIDESVEKIIKYIFNEYVKHGKTTEIANYLNKNKICSPAYHIINELGIKAKYDLTKGQYNWTNETVRKILKNRQYIGDVINNTKTQKNIIIENHHEPIIDKKIFFKVQKIINQRKHVQTTDDSVRLKHFFFDERGKPFIYMRCINKKNKVRYESYYQKDYSMRFNVKFAHQIIFNEVSTFSKLIKTNKEYFINEYKKKLSKIEKNNEYVSLQKSKYVIEKEIETIFESFAMSNISEELYLKKIDNLNSQLNIINERLKYCENKKENIKETLNKFTQFIDNLPNLDNLSNLDFIRTFVSKVIVTKTDTLHFKIVYKFEISV